MKNFCDSNFWDSNTTWYTNSPDFTECFKQTALQWIPCIFLWIFLPLELYSLKTSKICRISYNEFTTMKLVSIICMIGTCVVELGNNVWVRNTELLVDLLSPVIKLCSFILFLFLSMENIRIGVKTSGISFFFSLLSIICGIPAVRDIFRNVSSESYIKLTLDLYLFVVYYSSMIIIFVLGCSSNSKFLLSLSTNEKKCPSHNSSFLSNLYFNWFTEYVWKGYKTPFKDILWYVDYEDSAAHILKKFEKIWNSATRKQEEVNEAEGIPMKKLFPDKKETNFSIVGPISKLIWFQMLQTMFVKILEMGVNLSFPLTFSLLITTINQPNDEYIWRAYLCVFLFLGCPLIIAPISKTYYEIILRTQIRMKNAIMSLIYNKTLKLSNEARRQCSGGDIINLMSVDVVRISELVKFIHNIWAVPVHIAITLYILWSHYFGKSTIAAIIAITALLLINNYVVKFSKKLRIREMAAKDKRCRYLQEILFGIKVLKMYGWESSFEKIANRMRRTEMKYLKKLAVCQIVSNLFFNCTHFMLPLVTFATYILSNSKNVLNVEKAFVSISFFNALRIPMYELPALFDLILKASVSIKRINKFLNLEEINQNAVTHEKREEALIVENGEFAWEKNQDLATLKHINLRINRGSLVAIVGHVGSGKSSLISAFLGEMIKISGYVNVDGSTAYVPQQAWILYRTVKENITLSNTVDEMLYKKALQACALNEDLQLMPDGDKTEIGEKGTNLSGGQKQRISLARALCSNKDIYFFDDPLSAVDFNVAEHIFKNVLGPQSMLKNKTRILVTHSTAFLHKMDFIIVMKNGRISEKGTYDEIIRNNGAFAEFSNNYTKNLRNDINTKNKFNEEMSDQVSKRIIFNEKTNGKKSTNNNRTEHHTNKGLQEPKKLVQKEHTELGNIKLKVYKFYIEKGGFIYLFCTLFFHIILQCFLVLSNLWLAKWSTEEKNMSHAGINTLENGRFLNLSVYFILGISQALALVLAISSMQAFLIKASATIYNKLLQSVLRWPMPIFDCTPVGQIINRFTIDIDSIDNYLAGKLFMSLLYCGRFVASLAVVLSSTPICALFIIPAVFLIFIVQKYYMVVSYQLKRIDSVNKSPLYSYFVETISGLQSIRAYNMQEKFIKTTYDKYDLCSATAYCSFVCSRWLNMRLNIFLGVVLSIVSYFVISKRDMFSEGTLAFIITFTMQISKEVNAMILNLTEVENVIISVERIKEFIDIPREANQQYEIPLDWPTKGEIKFENFNLRYQPGLDLVLKDVNFYIQSEEKVGIIGRTGAGKSSIISALFRIVERDSGKILIDGVDISTINLHELRSKLTVIPQDPVLFIGTLRFNLDPFHAYKDHTLWDALEKAHLKNFVRNLPKTLHYEIKEGGGNLSFGQKQLICLARALLRKNKILILDEATASVDLETDELIQKTIRKEFSQCTIINIAHRLNTIQDYDKILVMENGTVKEFDSVNNVLKV